MQKHSHNKKYLNSVMIIVAVCLIGVLFAFVRVRHHRLTVNNYFINIDDAEEVRDIVASEFIIGETTTTEVENALNDGIFGDLDCLSSDNIDPRILCYALASYDMITPMNYLIIWRFSGDELVEIIVRVTTPGAI
jgi:hypothetical protein